MDRAEMREFAVGEEEFVMITVPLRNQRVAEPLSAAEREVAKMVVSGMTNAQIAEARGKSVRTIANQIASIFRKLNVGSRTELAAELALHPFGAGR